MADNSNPLAEFFAVQKQDVESLSSVKGPTRVGQPDQKGPVVGPTSFSGQVSQGIRAGAQQVESDIITAGAIVDYLRGNDDAAEAKMERSRELEQSFSTILEPFGKFEDFLDEPTWDGFADQTTKAVSMTTPQALFSFASAGAGLLAGFLGKQIISQGGKTYAKQMLLDIQRKKVMSNLGKGPGLTKAEQEILDTTFDGLKYAKSAPVGKGGQFAMAGNKYALARAESLRLPTTGAVIGALTQGEIVGASQSFKEYDEAGYELTAQEAKIAVALGFPQAVLDVVGEAAFFAPLYKKATGDLVKNSVVRQILDKPGNLSKKDIRVLKKAAGKSNAGEFLLDLGKAGAVGFAGSAVAEGLTERAQEEILIQQRFAIDPEYTKAEARIRGIEALFMGAMAGGARGAPSGVIAEAYKMVSTGGEMQQDLINEANARLTNNNLKGSVNPSTVVLSDSDYEGQIESMLDSTPKRALVWIPNRTKEGVQSLLEKFPNSSLAINEAAGGVLIFDQNSEVSRQKRDTALENDFTNPETFKNLFNLSALPESGEVVVRAVDSQGRIIDYESVPSDPAAIEAAYKNLEANNPGATIQTDTVFDFENSRQGELDLQVRRDTPLQEEMFFGDETDADIQGSRPSRSTRTLKPKKPKKAKAKPVKKNVPFKTFLRNNKLDPKASGVAELRDRLDRGTFSYTKTGGMGIDQLIEAAVDAGYLREDNAGPNGQKTYTIDDIVDLVDGDSIPLTDQEDSFEAQDEARRLEAEGEEETTSPIQEFIKEAKPKAKPKASKAETRDLGEDRDAALADAIANNTTSAEDIFAEGDSQEGVTTPTEEATDDDNDGRVFADAGDETLQAGQFVEGTLLFSSPKRAISAYTSAELKQKETPSEQEKQEFLDAIGPQVSTVNFDNVPLNLITEIMKAKKKDPSLDVGIETQENEAGELAYNARVLSSSFDQDLDVAIQNATNPQHLRNDLRKKYASDTGLDKLPTFNVARKKIKIKGKEKDFDIKKIEPTVRGGVYAQPDLFSEKLRPKTVASKQLYANGVSITQLLEFIIDRDGIDLNISKESRYAQALPTLIADLETIGRPLHYGIKGEQKNIIEHLNTISQEVVIAPIDVEYGPGGTVTNITEVDQGNSRIKINKNSIRQSLRAPSAEFRGIDGQEDNITAFPPVPAEKFVDQIIKQVGVPEGLDQDVTAAEQIFRDVIKEKFPGNVVPTDTIGGPDPQQEIPGVDTIDRGPARAPLVFDRTEQEAILDELSETYPELNQPREGVITLDEFAMGDRTRYQDSGPAQNEKAEGDELAYDEEDSIDILNKKWIIDTQLRLADDASKARAVTVKYLNGLQAVKTAEANNEGISVLRKSGEKHYGNPFSHLPNARDVKETKNLNDSVLQYEKWLEGTAHTDFKQERRQWVLDQIAEGKLAGKTILYYTNQKPNHAESLKSFAQKNQPKTTTTPLKIQDTTISPTVKEYFNNPDPTKKPNKNIDSKNNFAYKLLEVTKSIFKYNRKLTIITPEELIQQTQMSKYAFLEGTQKSNRDKILFTYAREMQDAKKLAQYVYLPDTDEDVIVMDISRIRGFSGLVTGRYTERLENEEDVFFADSKGRTASGELIGTSRDPFNLNRIQDADQTTAGQRTLDGVSLPVAMLALAHEMGHAVFRTELQLLLRNERGKTFLMDAFKKERDTTTDPKAKAQYNSKYGFEEWFADKLATVLLKKIRTGEDAKVTGFVDGYFTRLFKKIEQIYEKMKALVFGERFSETASGFGDFENYVNQVNRLERTYHSMHDRLQGMSFGQDIQLRDLIEETVKESGKSVSKKTLESIKTKILQTLRSKLPGQTTDKGFWSVAYLLQTSDGYLRGLGEAGKAIAKKMYSRSSSKDKFGFINARTLISNQNLNSMYDTTDENGNPVFRDGNGELNIELIAEAALQAEDDRVNTEDLPPAAKAMRKFLETFYKTYITPNNPNIRYKENFFSRQWLLSSIVNDPQKRQRLADLLEKYNPKVKTPKGFESWLGFVEAWAITDEDSDSTGNEKQSEEEAASTLSVGMAQERKKYFSNIPNSAARRGLDENGDVNVNGDAGLLTPADFAIKSYVESITKKLEYEKAVTVVPTKEDKAKLEELYGENKAEVLTRLDDGQTEVVGWRAMEVLLSRIEDDANREGARKAVEAQLGKVGMNMSPVMRQINSWALLGNMVTLLTFAAIASLPDLAGPILRSKDMNNKFGTIVEQLQYTIKNKKEAEQFARDLGVVTHDSIETMYINAAELGFMTEDTKRYARGFFRITLLEQYTKFTRVFAAGMGQQYLVRTAQKAKDGDETAIRHLTELQNNITPDEILIWASANKEGQRRFDTEGGKKVQEALGRFVEESIVRPNASERPVWASNPYFALVWQLKSFFYAYGKNIVGGVIREGRNKYRSDGQLSSRIMPLLIGASILLPLTALGLELREFIKFLGRSAIGDETGATAAFRSDNMPWGTYMFELLDRSGIYGPFGLLLPMAQAERYGDAWFLPALGPTAERFDDIFIDRTINTKDYLPFAAAIF
tara:strand:- start:3519 stop:11099 length:7581 start_codon:yes stop_codon:yes gene_type:complete